MILSRSERAFTATVALICALLAVNSLGVAEPAAALWRAQASAVTGTLTARGPQLPPSGNATWATCTNQRPEGTLVWTGVWTGPTPVGYRLYKSTEQGVPLSTTPDAVLDATGTSYTFKPKPANQSGFWAVPAGTEFNVIVVALFGDPASPWTSAPSRRQSISANADGSEAHCG